MRASRWIHTWRWGLALLLALGVWLCVQPLTAWACGGGIICVDADATGAATGLSWTDAYTNVQDALAVAVPGNEIWVAEGVYYPDEGSGQTNNARTSTFTLTNEVALYGGFAATETLLTQRDWTAHVTVLSGDIDGNDVNADGNRIAETWNDLVGANAYHVVSLRNVMMTTRLDGFTVTAGYANGVFPNSCGSGMFNNWYSHPTLTNVTFSGNWANLGGGGMFNDRSSNPTLTNVTFSGNRATNYGGGIYNNWDSSPTLTNVTFSGNQANAGGGMYNDASSPTLTNGIFSGNRADHGGGMHNNSSSSPTLANVTFSGNQADDFGGGMSNHYDSNPTLVNCILWGDSEPEIYNNDSTPNITFSDIQGWSGGGMGNLNADPQFAAPIAASSAPTTIGDYRLRLVSPAIDAGNNAAVPSGVVTDLDGFSRFVDLPTPDTGSGAAPLVDMGAYEAYPHPLLYVDVDATGAATGLSWANAYTKLQDALAVAGAGDEIWVAEGVYYPDEGRGQMNGALTATFTLRPGAALYGGFAATETELTQRDWTAHVTVLSGDIDGNDVNADGNRIAETWNDLQGYNAYHVVTSGGVTETARLDGFTVTAGYANGSDPDNSGGGMTNANSSPTLAHVTFSGNRAANYGGGMVNDASSRPTLMHVTFNGNQAFFGGGMGNDASSRPTLTNVTFSGNQATSAGGGMGNVHSNSTLTHVTFSGNQAAIAGGGMYNSSSHSTLTNVIFSGNQANSYGGGMYNSSSNPTLTNVTFSGNQATHGGGMYNQQYSGPTLVNCILWGDSATDGPEIYNAGSSSPTITYSDIQGWSGGGTGNLNADPQFVAPVAAGSAPTTDGDYHLHLNSPAVDAGNSLSVIVATDLAGNPRIMNGAVDMGAYEAHSNPIYVDADATGSGTGLSWTDAYANVQDALAGAGAGNEIWVAAGVYYPDEGCGQTNNARASTFTLRAGVALYGGFAATETLLTQRDGATHITVLSGDIDGNDVNADGNRIAETWNDLQGYNAYHVVTSSGVTETARLDGFTVTAGYASGASSNRHGGGMTNENSRPTLTHVTFSGNAAGGDGGGIGNYANSSSTLTHVTFSGNQAGGHGGGMDNYNSSPTLTHVTFSGNQAGGDGGGMENGNSSPTLTHVTFSGNQADGYGGGMDNYYNSNPTLTHVIFSGNQAGDVAGGMANYNSSNPTLTNVTFNGNQAGDVAGGMYNGGNATLTNVTFSGNRANSYGGGMYNYDDSSPTLVNCILWGDSAPNGPEIYNDSSSPTIIYSDIEWESGVYTGTGNLARDPQFVAPVAASSAPTTTGDYHLREDSPAIDAGAPATCPPDDLDGQPRADLRCDMGAYERQSRDGDTVIQRDFTGGTPYSFGPTWVSMTLAAADTGSITVTKHRTPPGGVWDAGEISVTWWISSSLSAGFPVTLSLCYTDAEVADLDESRLAMFRWNGSAWVDQNATPDPAHHCVTLSGVTGFSAWTLKDVSVGAATPTAARVVGLAAWGFAPVAILSMAGLLVLGGATTTLFRRRRRL